MKLLKNLGFSKLVVLGFGFMVISGLTDGLVNVTIDHLTDHEDILANSIGFIVGVSLCILAYFISLHFLRIGSQNKITLFWQNVTYVTFILVIAAWDCGWDIRNRTALHWNWMLLSLVAFFTISGLGEGMCNTALDDMITGSFSPIRNWTKLLSGVFVSIAPYAFSVLLMKRYGIQSVFWHSGIYAISILIVSWIWDKAAAKWNCQTQWVARVIMLFIVVVVAFSMRLIL